MGKENELKIPILLPREITTREELNDFLEKVEYLLIEKRSSEKFFKWIVKILMFVISVMSLLLSVIFPPMLIIVCLTFLIGIKYKVNPMGLTLHEKTVLKNFERQFETLNKKGDFNKNKFRVTKKIGGFAKGIHLDEDLKQLKIVGNREGIPQIFNYSDVIDAELIEDGHSIIKTSALPKAIAGGILFGGIGAIVGGVTGKQTEKKICSNLSIKITVRNCKHFCLNIDLINSKVKNDSPQYKQAYEYGQEMIAACRVMQVESN